MNARRIFIIITTIVLISAVFVGAANALGTEQSPARITTLENVRDYTATPVQDVNYAVDGGNLLVGGPAGWTQIDTPNGVIVSTVDVDLNNPDTLYMGAANEMALYRSLDGGHSWERYALSEEAIGGVSDIAVDSFQRLVYVGTDTAGLFRLRDVGSSLVLGAQLLLDEPVVEVVADDTGAGMAFARTEWNLYRAEDYGLNWIEVDNLQSVPTALAVVNDDSPMVYVGTTDRGLLRSLDGGFNWELANEGLGFSPGTRLQIDALSADPMQPEVLYVASSYLFGSTTVHESPSSVAMTTNGGEAWTLMNEGLAQNATVAELLPVSGETGAVYALTMQSRSPQPLGSAPVIAAEEMADAADVASSTALNLRSLLAWVIAGLAALALVLAVAMDLRGRSRKSESAGTLVPSPVRNHR